MFLAVLYPQRLGLHSKLYMFVPYKKSPRFKKCYPYRSIALSETA